MKALFWIPPWGSQGNPLFYRNCVRKHLIPQANLLSEAGLEVDFVLPALLEAEAGLINSRIRVIRLSALAQLEIIGSVKDPSVSLYAGNDDDLVNRIAIKLEKILSRNYDVILLWETPVPFLEQMYPEALIVHQMPGVFSRPPYPHMVTFDPVGLYKRGSLYKMSREILSAAHKEQDISFARSFALKASNEILRLRALNPMWLDELEGFSKLVLLPLQVTKHYNFKVDTSYEDQSDLLLDVLTTVDNSTGVIVTQYVTPNVKETILNSEIASSLKDKFPNLVYRAEFDNINSISQYILPIVDEVVTCSSSIGIQGMMWKKKLKVVMPTFIAPFSAEKCSSYLEWDDVCDRTLSFIINRNQPLASSILSDKQFAVSLLEEMLGRKRKGCTGLDLLPRLSDIKDGYEELLYSAFRVGQAIKDIGKKNSHWIARETELRKFRNLMRDPSVQVITFDIFDTLVQRATEKPADVFKFLEKKALEITIGVAQEFASVREALEVETRARIEPLEGEITLDDIYSSIKEYYNLDDEKANRIKEEEVRLEIQLSMPRKMGKALWVEALATGKPIYLISDMYLPIDVVESILKKSGYSGYEEIYLSSVRKLRKRDGRLFDLFLSERRLAPSSVLHIGDNKNNDVVQPERKGIRTRRWASAIEWQRSNSYFKDIYSAGSRVGGRARSVLAGLTAQALFDEPAGKSAKNSLFEGQPYYLGYAALGPMYAAYMLWLHRQAVNDGVSHLYFLSREGWLFREIYDALFGGSPGALPTSYLYASRRAVRVAGLKTVGDILAFASTPFTEGASLSQLLSDRFGVSPDVLTSDVLDRAGVAYRSASLDSGVRGQVKFAKVCALVADRILEQAERERTSYHVYLQQSGILEASKPAVVDLGWKANIQGALGELLGRGLHGYYYLTFQGAEIWTAKGHVHKAFAGDYVVHERHSSAAVRNRALLEYLTCHFEPSLVRMECDGNRWWPVFRSEPERVKRRILIEEVHRGAIAFARDLRRYYSNNIDEIFIDSNLAERVFESFSTHPAAIDAAMFVGCQVEDAVGGAEKRYIISPNVNDPIERSVWRAGALALQKSGKNGTGRRPDSVASTKEADSITMNSVGSRIVLEKLEKRIVETFLDGKKRRKYERDRDAFFQDSKSKLAKAWYKLTAA